MQTIKDVNQSLVDDSLILSDKIGAANFFWSFPSKTYLDQVTQKNNYEVSIGALKRNIETDTESIENLKKVRCMANRNELLQELNNLKSEEKKIDEVIEQYKYNDPEEIQKIEKEIEYIREHANRWTDNVWSIKSFLVKKKGMNSKEVCYIIFIKNNLYFQIIFIIY